MAAAKEFREAFEAGELLNCEGNEEKFIFWYCGERERDGQKRKLKDV